MSFRPSKITKFFPIESSNDPYRFFPGKKQAITNSSNEPQDDIVEPTQTPLQLSVSQFDQLPISLVTFYNSNDNTLYYSLYMNNLRSKSIFSKIININNQILGDLMATIESLQYIIYNPSFFQTLNKQKLVLYTNSLTISNIFKPFSSLLSDNDLSKAYFKIQGLLKCIKHITIEFRDVNQYPCSEAFKILQLNIQNERE